MDEVTPAPDGEQILPPSYTAPSDPDDDRGFVPLHHEDGRPPKQPSSAGPAVPAEDAEPAP